MANARNKKFSFGFYNSAQDEDHLQSAESPNCYNLDADKLGLGTLEYRNYVAGGEAPVDKTTASLSGRAFRLNLGQPEFEKQSGLSDWEGLNDNSYPPSPSAPSITAVTAVNGSVSAGDIVGVTFTIPTAYTGPVQRTYIVEIQADPGASEDVTIRWKFSSDTSWRAQNVEATFGVSEPLTEGVEVTIPSGTYTPGDQCSYNVSKINLPDGSYVYTMVNIASGSHDPAVNVESVPSAGTLFVLDNISDTDGSIQSNLAAKISFDDPLPANVDDQWLYRKDPDTDKYVLVEKRSNLSSPFEFTDLTETAQLQSIELLEGEDDLTFSDIYTAIGASTMDRIFEKDNRIWLVPTERPDLVLYSEVHDFWRFRLANTFSFGGDIREIKFIKDSSVVGGEFTTVFFTSSGIYHIVGEGTENSPYRRITAIADVAVEENSVVDMNGIIALASEGTAYDEGQYGRKLYEYDLSKLIEISARAKEDAFFGYSPYTINWSKILGGDKYVIYNSTEQRGLVYHRDAQGTMPFDQAQSGWYWKSKRFNVDFLFRAAAGYARFLKFELKGNITFTLTLFADDLSETDQLVLNLSKVNRGEVIQRMPRISGRKWQVEFSGGSTDILYNFYLVL